MSTNDDGKEIICETKMQIAVYVTNGGSIAIQQDDEMMGDPSLIIVHKSDVRSLVRALNKLVKNL